MVIEEEKSWFYFLDFKIKNRFKLMFKVIIKNEDIKLIYNDELL